MIPPVLFLVLGASLAAFPPEAAAQQQPVDPDRLVDLLGEIGAAEAELQELAGPDGLPPEPEPSPFPDGWPDLSEYQALPPIRAVVQPTDRSIGVVTSQLWHTTIRLPPDEQIVDFVVGDSLYFDLRGGDNMAYLKAMANDRRTHVSLVTDWDRTYSFDVFSTAAVRPDEVLNVTWPTDVAATGEGGGLVAGFSTAFALDFVDTGRLDQLRRQIDQAYREVRRIEEDGARQLARVEDLAARREDEFLRTYPRRIYPRYRLTPEIQAPPISIHQIWSDGRFTYLRSTASESPAVYTLSGEEGEEPVLVNVTLTPDSLYVIDHVVGAGFAQLHGVRGEWHLWDLPPVSFLPDLVEAGLPLEGPPVPWVPTRSQKTWVQRHPRLFGVILAGGIGGYVALRALR